MTNVAHKRPQLTVDELHQLKWLLGGVLSLIALSTVFYMDVEAWTLMALTAAATVATLVWPTLPARLPSLAHTLAFPIIVAFFAVDLWLKTEVLPAMVRLDILLLLYRGITYRQRRDDLQIIVLGLFLIIVAGVLTVSLTFAAQILVYTGSALALLLAITLSEAANGPAPRVAMPLGEVPAWARHADWPQLFRRLREVTDWRVVGLGAVLFVGVVGVSALLFLLIPRFQIENSMFLDRFISKKSRTGFSDTIRFGDVTEIQQDNSVALSVDVSDQNQIPQSPYWRMLVLDHYSDGTFRLSPTLRAQEFSSERTQGFLHGEAKPKQGSAVMWTFYLESGVSRFLPLLGVFETLRFRESQNFRQAPYLAIVQLREEPVTMTAYRVEGFELTNSIRDPNFARIWRNREQPSPRRLALQNRVGVTREADLTALTGALAEATRGEKLPAEEFGRRVGGWLKSTHGYSLSPSIPAGPGDPLVRWMVSRESGHCELFAGSFVLLARAAGFPARVVTGFRGGSWNGYSNNFSIRNADAHAWAEIFDVDSASWLRVDPLAVAEAQAVEVKGEAAVASRLDRSWGARFDSLRVFWYRRIVNFDQRSQVETLKAVKQATENSGRRLREFFSEANRRVIDWVKSPWSASRFLGLAAVLSVGWGMFWWWREHGRGWWRRLFRPRGDRRDDPVRREAGWWLARTGESGSRIHEIDTTLVADLQRVRFGAKATWPEPVTVFRRARSAVRAARRNARLTRS